MKCEEARLDLVACLRRELNETQDRELREHSLPVATVAARRRRSGKCSTSSAKHIWRRDR